MKKFSYFLSLAFHALLLFAVLSARFRVTIRPEPRRVVVVAITEPAPPYAAGARPQRPRQDASGRKATPGSGAGAASGSRGGAMAALSSLPRLDLTKRKGGDFRLAPVGKSPEPWAEAAAPRRTPQLLRYRAGDYFGPGAAPGAAGGPAGGVFLLPFDIAEKSVADWTEAVVSRVERNWFVPASGRLAFSGRVQISLTIERQGRQLALAVDDASVPDALIQAALHAVQASLPLPPIPENVAGDSLAFTFVFAYNG